MAYQKNENLKICVSIQKWKLKDLCIHPASKVYKGVCICGETDIGETIGNVETRSKEQNRPSDKSSLVQDINSHLDHMFTFSIICDAPTNKFERKVIEVYFIARN